jgi:hypothetical protein
MFYNSYAYDLIARDMNKERRVAANNYRKFEALRKAARKLSGR